MSSPRARYIMIGGFLGAGKTTSILAFSKYLDMKGLKVGLITNDQGGGLVDTNLLASSSPFPVEEIAGGCFCCRFNSLVEAAANLSKETRPDIFLAEPVGSCTDLMATVNLPLQQIYGHDFVVSPLSVVVDPVRARRVLGLDDSGKRLSKNVCYIYEKQLEEAEIIVINKIDLLSDPERSQLRDALSEKFPNSQVVEIAAREEREVAPWFEAVLEAESKPLEVMKIDYDRYGEGEALLGWLNATLHLEAPGEEEFDGNVLLHSLAISLRTLLEAQSLEVAHLKMTLTPFGDPYEIAAANLVRTDDEPHLSHHLTETLDEGELSLNIRAEADPAVLESATHQALEEIITGEHNLSFTVAHLESFRPGMPVPVHRLASV